LEAKAQLNLARRMDIPPQPPDGPDKAEKEKERDDALARQREEAKKAQPLFLDASRRFAEAAAQLKARLGEANLDPATRQALAREVFEADLASAVNQYYLAETVLTASTSGTKERDKYLEEARAKFAALAEGSPGRRTAGVA